MKVIKIILIILIIAALVLLALHLMGKTKRTIETVTHIDAPPEAVWQALTDFDSYPAWNSPLVYTKAPGAVGEGFSFHFVNEKGEKGMEISPTLKTMDLENGLSWQGSLLVPGIFDGTHYFRVEAAPEGGSTLTHGEAFSGILIPFTGAVFTETESHFIAFNQRLKQQVESAPPAP
jgi:hypothetical protein